MLLLAPFRQSTWKVVDTLNGPHRLDWIHDADEENNEAVERLLEVQRPRAAFASMHFQLEKIKPALLFRLLSEMVKEGNDKPGHYQLAHTTLRLRSPS
jgi:hypothetical protein